MEIHADSQSQSGLVEVFIELLDGIFYSGYARNLAEQNPELYNYEFSQFLLNYSL